MIPFQLVIPCPSGILLWRDTLNTLTLSTTTSSHLVTGVMPCLNLQSSRYSSGAAEIEDLLDGVISRARSGRTVVTGTIDEFHSRTSREHVSGQSRTKQTQTPGEGRTNL